MAQGAAGGRRVAAMPGSCAQVRRNGRNIGVYRTVDRPGRIREGDVLRFI